MEVIYNNMKTKKIKLFLIPLSSVFLLASCSTKKPSSVVDGKLEFSFTTNDSLDFAKYPTSHIEILNEIWIKDQIIINKDLFFNNINDEVKLNDLIEISNIDKSNRFTKKEISFTLTILNSKKESKTIYFKNLNNEDNVHKIIKNLQKFYSLPTYNETLLNKVNRIQSYYNSNNQQTPFLKYVYAVLKSNNKDDAEISNYINKLNNDKYVSTNYVNELYDLIKHIELFTSTLFYGKSTDYNNLKEILKEILDDFFANFYNPVKKRPGNWWYWEIAVPKRITQNFAFLKNIYSIKEYELWTNSILEYTSGYLSQYGGNLTDITIPRVISFVMNNSENELSNLIEYIFKMMFSNFLDANNKIGTFYEDGSFLEHGKIPYFAGYGEVWLRGVKDYKFILHESQYGLEYYRNFENFYKIIEVAIMPYMYDLSFTITLGGRGISRRGYNEKKKGNFILTLLLDFVDDAPLKYKDRLINFILDNISSPIAEKHISQELKKFKQVYKYQEIKSREVLNDWNELHRFTNDPNTLFGVDNFNKNNKMWFAKNQDRYVFQKDDFALVLPLISQRTMQSENMNGENFFWYYYSNGNTMINKKNKDNSYSWDYFLGVDPFKMPGTSSIYEFDNQNMTLDEIKKNETKSKYLWKNMNKGYSNGISLNEYGFVTSNIHNYDEKLWTNKNYIVIDDVIFVLGKVNKTTENNKQVLTTIANDWTQEEIKKETLSINGKEIDKLTSNEISYYVLENKEAITYQNIERVLNNQTNNISIPPGTTKFNFNEIFYDHSRHNNPLFSYIIAPNNKSDVKKIISNMNYEMNDDYSLIKYINESNKKYYFIHTKSKNQELNIDNRFKMQFDEEITCILEEDGNNYKMVISPNYDKKNYNFKIIGNFEILNKNKNEITNNGAIVKVNTNNIKTDVLHNSWLEFKLT